MSAQYEELIAAGAPRLPEGYYYKIYTCDLLGGETVAVDVRRERGAWWDKRMARNSYWASQVSDIHDLAHLCTASHAEAFPPRAAEGWLGPFMGRHP